MIFWKSVMPKFDAILAIYHDQGLIPFKTLSFGEGVNFTAGLDRVRTSLITVLHMILLDRERRIIILLKKHFTAGEIFLNRKKFNDCQSKLIN